MTTFPAALRRARIQRGLSQTKLAEIAGKTHGHISRLEMDAANPGSRRPARETVLYLAAALGCDDLETDELLIAAGFGPESDYMTRVIAKAMTHRRQVEQKREAWERVGSRLEKLGMS